MNKSIKIFATATIAALATFLTLLLAGLGTTGLTDLQGNWVSMTTVNLGVNEFGLLMIIVVLLSVVLAGFALNTLEKKSP
jgi:hypothetical protein